MGQDGVVDAAFCFLFDVVRVKVSKKRLKGVDPLDPLNRRITAKPWPVLYVDPCLEFFLLIN